ncbi:MAG: hypothetical protein HFI86_05515 [Bacilli bacterium]|nr:hypothetical protein [Bacilli bacterium]
MPDLYVVMSDDELVEAINYAKENGTSEAFIVENIQYALFFNKIDAINYCNDGQWFPHFSHYINLKTTNDEIGILLSSTIWNDFDLLKLYEILKCYGISYKMVEDKWYNHDSVKDFNEKNRLAAKKYPVNSPWTARDIEVVQSALESIEDINSAKIIHNANVEMSVFKYLPNMTPIPTQKQIVELSYPNILHLDTADGEYNVFMGPAIKVDDVEKLLINSNILFSNAPYDPTIDANLLLYKTRDRNIWEDEKRGRSI